MRGYCVAGCLLVAPFQARHVEKLPFQRPSLLPPLACRRPLQERQTLEEAEGLLKKMGFTGSLFQGAPPPQPDEDEEEEGEEE